MNDLMPEIVLSQSLGTAFAPLNSGLLTRSSFFTSFSISVRLRRISASVSMAPTLAGIPEMTAPISTTF